MRQRVLGGHMSYSILNENIKVKSKDDHYFTREEWDSYQSAKPIDIEAFKDMRVGLFLHVGISAIGKVDISWAKVSRKMPDCWTGKIPDEQYYSWVDKMNFEAFNAEEWIDIAMRSGMKYVVVITKHHDGFHMWDTAYNDFKITNCPFKRDYLKEIADACHKANMPLGLYYSQRDWYHADYEAVDPTKAVTTTEPPFFQMKDGEVFQITDKHKKYIEYMHNAVLELMTKYGKIDILWWDSSWVGGMFRKEMWDSEVLERKVRELQPHIVINNRAGLVGDFDTPEGYIGLCQKDRPWETCMTLGPHWAWTNNNPKSLRKIIMQLVASACGDGNYLLSIGCKPDGSLAEKDVARLLELGDWLNVYGESIYGTRAGNIIPNGLIGSTENNKAQYIHVLRGKTVEISDINNYILPPTTLSGEMIKVITKDGKTYIKIRRKFGNIDSIVKLEKIKKE